MPKRSSKSRTSTAWSGRRIAAADPGSALPATAADSMALYVLADRAELWATIAPGLGHHLSNALMSLSLPGRHEELRLSAQSRIEKANRILHGMCETSPTDLPQALTRVLQDVEDWHRLQMGLPACELHVRIEPGLPGVADARLHHALLAMLTLAKEEGAARIEIAAAAAGGGIALEVSAGPSTSPGSGPAAARRMRVH